MNRVSAERADESLLVVRVTGSWRLQAGLSSIAVPEQELNALPPPARVAFDTRGLTDWDSSILTFLTRLIAVCRQRQAAVDTAGLPAGIRRLLELAGSAPERKGSRAAPKPTSILERVGTAAIGVVDSGVKTLSFLGETTITGVRFLGMKARYQASDLWLLIQQCGPQALPIVTLISFLVGLILAFVGAVQLQQFGAQIYVANLVGIATVREMGAMMTAIIMAGRSGAAFAAELGAMKVAQEIDALNTSGFSSFEFLVLPRVVALTLMMPLLCLYADLVGIVGGAVIGVSLLDLSWTTYIQQTIHAVRLTDVFSGVLKSTVYGFLIALAGCLRGLQAGGSSASVGAAATSAVVTAIVAIIVACGAFAVLFHLLGI